MIKLVENDDYYKNMEEDAFEVAVHYTNAQELIETGDNYSGEDGKVDMCRAIKELIADGRAEGITQGFCLTNLSPSPIYGRIIKMYLTKAW